MPNFSDPEDRAMAAAIEDATGGHVTNKAECRSCGAAVFWVELPSGKKCPYDAEVSDDPVSHFATCPDAGKHRKPKGGGRR